MNRFSRTSLERLGTCHPDLVRLFDAVLQQHDCTVLQGLRTDEEQAELYRQGRTTLDGVTKRSKHQGTLLSTEEEARAAYHEATATARAARDKNTAAARAAYREARAEVYVAYNDALSSVRAAYDKDEAEARAAYDEAVTATWDARDKALAAAYAAYNKVEAEARAAYDEALRPVSFAVDVAPYFTDRDPHIDWRIDRPAVAALWLDFARIVLRTADTMGIAVRWGGDWDRDWDRVSDPTSDQRFNDWPHWELV